MPGTVELRLNYEGKALYNAKIKPDRGAKPFVVTRFSLRQYRVKVLMEKPLVVAKPICEIVLSSEF